MDELNSFLLEEISELEKISELDLDKISGGASVSDAVKRGAASLMAILNLSGMSNSYAGMPNSAKVRRDNGAVISKSKVVLSKEEIAEKWVKRLGASAAGITLTLLAVIGLNKLKNDVTADQILEVCYRKLSSHACMEGHSPGEIPLGESGAQRVLFVGTKTKDMDEVVERARGQKMKVNCIDRIPQTRKELIAEFERCT